MFAGILFPLAVTGIWALVFVISLLLFRLGMRERDAETAQLIEDEDESIRESGWAPLSPLKP